MNMKKIQATFPRAAALAFAQFVVSAPDMTSIATEARRVADTLPATKNKNPAQPRKGWKEHFIALAEALETGSATYTIFGASGNIKLGDSFYTFSTLPIVTCPGAGSCKGPCYSLKAWAYPGAYFRQVYNTILLRFNRRAIIEAFKLIPADATLRLYVDGDFDSVATFVFWMNLLRQRPDIVCYGYSKSWEVILAVPPSVYAGNYVLNISSGSVYDDDAEMRARMLALPITRGEFIMVKTEKNWGRSFDKYSNPEYHRDVRRAAAAAGIGRAFSCTGNCEGCIPAGHGCGVFDTTETGERMYKIPIPIVIGIH
jgi:hypothetical protein